MTISSYHNKSISEIIYDFAVIRGDLSEQYARDALVSIITDRIIDRAIDVNHLSRLYAALRKLVSDWQANGNSRELGDPTAETWQQAARQLLDVLGGAA